ncbi:hypothetical protein ACP4OV_010653 [Aristida adscensionis]
MAAAAAVRKRPEDEGAFAFPVAGGRKRARRQFRSIYDYDKLEALGEGSYGVVTKARDRRTGETVAVKWVRPDGDGEPDLRAVLLEARCLAAFRGAPSVVQIRDVAADAATGDVFLVMEFVGPSLGDLLAGRRRLSEAETRACMRQLLAGAGAMHGAGIIHRDIKPDNVLVGAGGALKICDLGLAAPARPAGTPYPEAENCVCTLWYRAPELLMGFPSYGPAVDIWSLGCVMAELLAGEPLFDETETEDEMLAKVLELRYEIESTEPEEQAFQGLPGLSEAGREVLCGLLSFEADERLTAAEALGHRWFAEDDAPLPPAPLSAASVRLFEVLVVRARNSSSP